MTDSKESPRDLPDEGKELDEIEVAPQQYTDTGEFKERERRVVRKLDIFIAPLMGAFNFIVSLCRSSWLLYRC